MFWISTEHRAESFVCLLKCVGFYTALYFGDQPELRDELSREFKTMRSDIQIYPQDVRSKDIDIYRYRGIG